MSVDLVANPVRFLSQPKLRCRLQHAAYPFLRQIFERRLTASRPRQRDICVKHLGQRRRIDAHLRNIVVRRCAREKFTVASLDKNVKHSRFERRIDRVTVCFPIAIEQVDLDAAATRLAPIYANCSITKIRASLAVPGAELDDLDFVSGSTNKTFAKIPGKPARLQFQLRWDSRRDKQRALTNAIGIAHLRVVICQSAHARIMKKARAKVTRGVMRALRVSRAGERRLPACRSRQLAETGKWIRVRSCVAQDVAGRAAGNYRLAACAPQKHARDVRYPIGVAESVATCSCNAGSLTRSRKYWTICSTNPASDRAKMNEYFGAFPVAAEITRFSNKNRGS